MRQLSISKIIIRCFRSFANEEITFSPTTGLFLLTGENLLEKRLGANGAGKSTLWNATLFALYGVGRVSSLISWGASTTEVIVFLQDNLNNVNRIHRFGPPAKLELNGKPAFQQDIDNLLGLSKTCFQHSVVFGQGQPLFPDLSIPERGDLLDSVLDLDIWQKATEIASIKYREFEAELAAKKTNLSFLSGKLSSLPTDQTIQSEIDFWETEKTQQLQSLFSQAEEWDQYVQTRVNYILEQGKDWNKQQERTILDLEQQAEVWKQKLLDQVEIKARALEALEGEAAPLSFTVEATIANPFAAQIRALEGQLNLKQVIQQEGYKKVVQLEQNLKSCVSMESLWHNDVCPTCLRPISANKKQHELVCVQQLNDKVTHDLHLANTSLQQVEVDVLSINKELRELRAISIREEEKQKSLQRDVSRLQAQIKSVEADALAMMHQYDDPATPYSKQISLQQRKINPYIQEERELLSKTNPFPEQINQLKAKQNPFTTKLSSLKKERKELLAKQVTIEAEYNKVENTMMAVEYWRHGFKRIRLYFIEQILLALQVEIQAAIAALGLRGWKIKLSTESITRSETVKLGVQIHIKSPIAEGNWGEWSGGETQRLRLAIAMGLASLIQRASGVQYTQEVWDEPTRALSMQGVEDLLEALRYRATSLKKQIFLTDHSAIQHSAFDAVWSVVKDSKGSKVKKIS